MNFLIQFNPCLHVMLILSSKEKTLYDLGYIWSSQSTHRGRANGFVLEALFLKLLTEEVGMCLEVFCPALISLSNQNSTMDDRRRWDTTNPPFFFFFVW